jgi:hypothetical protein
MTGVALVTGASHGPGPHGFVTGERITVNGGHTID